MGDARGLRVVEALSTHADAGEAVAEVADVLLERLGRHPDALLVFMTPHHHGAGGLVLRRLQRRLSPDAVVGGTFSGVIGGGREVEREPGLAVWGVHLPGTRLQSFHLSLGGGGSVVRGWPDVDDSASVVLLPDSYSFPVEPFLDSIHERRPDLPSIVGGMLSGADRAGGNLLFTEDGLHDSGAVGLVLQGGCRLQPLVAAGCRAFGPALRVTRSEHNLVYELGGRPAFEGLSELLAELDDASRRSFMRAPHVGVRPAGSPLEAGDFLVRGVMGVDPEDGAIALSEQIEDGALLRFQMCDHRAADEQMRNLLGMANSYHDEVHGALLFCCGARGRNLFRTPDHDVATMREFWPGLPVAGAFVDGELGPQAGRPGLHGLTATMGLLVPSGA